MKEGTKRGGSDASVGVILIVIVELRRGLGALLREVGWGVKWGVWGG